MPRKRRLSSDEEDEPPLPKSLQPPKKKRKPSKPQAKAIAPRGSKRKAGVSGNKATKRTRVVQSQMGQKAEDFVDPGLFSSNTPVVEKVVPPQKKQSSVSPPQPPVLSPPRRLVKKKPFKQNIVPAVQTNVHFVAPPAAPPQNIQNSPNEDVPEVAKKNSPSMQEKCKDAARNVIFLLFIIGICSWIFPLFLEESPLSIQQRSLETKLEDWIVKQLQNQKGRADCHEGYEIYTQDDVMKMADNHFSGYLWSSEAVQKSTLKVLNSSPRIENGHRIYTLEDSIKSRECQAIEDQVDQMHKVLVTLLEYKQGDKKCAMWKWGEEFKFPIAEAKSALRAKFPLRSGGEHDKLFADLISWIRDDKSSELKIKGQEIWSISTRYSISCSIQEKLHGVLSWIIFFLLIAALVGYVAQARAQKQQQSEEASQMYQEVMQHLKNKSRSVSSWVPIPEVKHLIHEGKAEDVWVSVEKMVAKNPSIAKGMQPVHGLDQKCWKMDP